MRTLKIPSLESWCVGSQVEASVNRIKNSKYDRPLVCEHNLCFGR